MTPNGTCRVLIPTFLKNREPLFSIKPLEPWQRYHEWKKSLEKKREKPLLAPENIAGDEYGFDDSARVD